MNIAIFKSPYIKEKVQVENKPPFSAPLSSPFNNKYEERPLKSNSRNLSFKGLLGIFLLPVK